MGSLLIENSRRSSLLGQFSLYEKESTAFLLQDIRHPHRVGKMDPPIVTLYPKDVAALCVFIVSLIGFFMNSTVAVFTKKLPTMNNPFGRLTASQSAGEAILCGIFAFYYFPMVFYDVDWMYRYSQYAGFINLICYDVCIWSHLFISINRLVAICFPLHYGTFFSSRNTTVLSVFSWVIAILTAVLLFKTTGCDIFYAPQYWAFVFEQTDICKFVTWNLDFYKDLGIVGMIGLVDFITLCKVHMIARNPEIGTVAQVQRRNRELNFLKQAILQGIIFAVELFTYFILAWKFENKWAIWSLTTLAWTLVHTVDGFIIVIFNLEFRALVTSPLKKLHSAAAKQSSDLQVQYNSQSVPNLPSPYHQ